jgi:hypothetical protein
MEKEKEMIARNIELSAEFSRYVFEHAELEEKIPMEAEIIFLPDYDKELKKFNRNMGKNIEADGTKVVYVSIKNLRPKVLSRIINVKVKSVA